MVEFTVFKGSEEGKIVKSTTKRDLRADEVLIKITHSGVCGTYWGSTFLSIREYFKRSYSWDIIAFDFLRHVSGATTPKPSQKK
jgi:hypothetical protein